ncbi:MAG: hypothetical protein A2X94_00410 [Bdellovibrionales bacterium GWB1_55_8]|nr:MAG: hypothetical protein A2X94_00410 [Bdellovibrionales bacterium GWB1_55_8]
MTRAIKTALLLLLTAVAGWTGATPQVQAGEAGQLAWQKLKFEELLQDRIRKALVPVIPENQLIVSASIQLAVIAAKKGDGDLNSDDTVFLEKLDMSDPAVEAAFAEADLLDSIKGLSISVLYDNSVPATKRPIIEQITKNIAESLGDLKPVLKIEQADLTTPPIPEQWDLKRWILEFKNGIGILLGVFFLSLILGTPSLLVVNEFRKLQARKISLLEVESTRKQNAENEETERKNAEAFPTQPGQIAGIAAVSGAGAPGSEAAEHGIEQFRQFLKEAPERAAGLVRQWIKAPIKGAADALAFLPDFLSSDELNAIFNQLSIADRQEWKQLTKVPSPNANAKDTEKFIRSQTLDVMLVPPPTSESDARALATDLSTTECAQLISDDQQLGAALLNILPSAQVSKLMAVLSPDVVNQISSEGLTMTETDLHKNLAGLKRAVTELRRDSGSGKKTPFYYETIELLYQLTPQKQEALFNAMAAAGEYALLEAGAKRFLPSDIVLKLPDDLLRSCLNRLPVAHKAELIVSLDESQRQILLKALGEPGTKLRDLVEFEVQTIEANEVQLRRTRKKKDSHWQQFVETVRTTILLDEAAADSVSTALNEWLYQKTEGRFGENGNAKKVA